MKNVGCIIVVLGVLLGGAMQVAAETYKLANLPLIGWSYYQVALVKGFWEKQGLTLEFLDYVDPYDHLQGYMQKRYVFAPGPVAVITNHRKDGIDDSICIGTLSIANHHKYVIIKKNLLNQSLKGQTIGIFSTSDVANLFLLSTYLNTVNTSLADIRLVLMSPDELEANFIHNRLHAVLTVDRGNKFYEQAEGVIAHSTRSFYEPHGVNIRKSVFDTIPPEDIKKFLRGCIEAIEWIRDPANWEEYKDILSKYYLAGRDLSDEQIRELLQDGQIVDPQTLIAHNQERLSEYFTQLRAFVAAEGLLQGETLNNFTYDKAIHNQLLLEVLQEFVE